MLIIYGSDQCPDCLDCKADLNKAGVAYEYRSIPENLLFLKEFLMLRDRETVFDAIKEAGKIGIPCVLQDDGTVTLSWEKFL